MDRLHIVTVVALAVAAGGVSGGTGCERGGGAKKEPAATGERVDAVQAGKEKPVSLEEFCDVRAKSDAEARTLSLPPLSGGKSVPGKGTWRWLNVWATWCQPCIEEIPHLSQWHEELGAAGTKYDLVFISVDDNDDQVARFREKYPATPESLRLADPEALPKLLEAVGVDKAAPIPVHVFVDPQDRVRCVRVGAVKERDLSAVRAILGSG